MYTYIYTIVFPQTSHVHNHVAYTYIYTLMLTYTHLHLNVQAYTYLLIHNCFSTDVTRTLAAAVENGVTYNDIIVYSVSTNVSDQNKSMN